MPGLGAAIPVNPNDPDRIALVRELASTIEVNPTAFHQIRDHFLRRGISLSERVDVGAVEDFAQHMFGALAAADRQDVLRGLLVELNNCGLLSGESTPYIDALFGGVSPFTLPDLEVTDEEPFDVQEDDRGLNGIFADSVVLDFEMSAAAVATLQAADDEARPFVDASVMSARLMSAINRVCHIAVDGKHSGTGILLRPTLVATAAHVVRCLIDPTKAIPVGPDGHWVLALPGSLAKITITFGDSVRAADDGFGLAGRPERPPAELHQQWLAYYSPPSPNELTTPFDIGCVDGIEDHQGPWDLAILRLGRPPGDNEKGHPAARTPPPEGPFPISILSHPKGIGATAQGMKQSAGMTSRFIGSRRRMLHNARTKPGSSGAPCFNDNWEVVALHQAGDQARNVNRAVPVEPWKSSLDTILHAADRTVYIPDVAALAGGARQPVIGRRQTQRNIDRALLDGASATDRLLVVRGKPGRGKTFTSRLIEAKQLTGQPQFALNIKSLADFDAWTLYAHILKILGKPPGEAIAAYTGEDRAALKLVPDLVAALRKLAGAEGLWLILDGFDAEAMPQDASMLQLIDGLIEQLESLPELRLALLGWPRPLIPIFKTSIEDLDLQAVAPTGRDIVDYLILRCGPAGVELPVLMIDTLVTQFNGFVGLLTPWAAADPDYFKQLLMIAQPSIDFVQKRIVDGAAHG